MSSHAHHIEFRSCGEPWVPMGHPAGTDLPNMAAKLITNDRVCHTRVVRDDGILIAEYHADDYREQPRTGGTDTALVRAMLTAADTQATAGRHTTAERLRNAAAYLDDALDNAAGSLTPDDVDTVLDQLHVAAGDADNAWRATNESE